MITENRILMTQARESLKGKWGKAVEASLLYVILMIAIHFIPYASGFITSIISGPLALGFTIFWLKISRNQEAIISKLWIGFDRFWDMFVTKILLSWFTFLWSLLLIVPGIIASLSYSMTFYIMVEDETIKPMDAIDKSKKMMYGYKWKFFCLNLRFLGWALLCILTAGIGFLWLMPYINVSIAKFYDDIKGHEGVEVPEIIEVPQVVEVPQAI